MINDQSFENQTLVKYVKLDALILSGSTVLDFIYILHQSQTLGKYLSKYLKVLYSHVMYTVHNNNNNNIISTL